MHDRTRITFNLSKIHVSLKKCIDYTNLNYNQIIITITVIKYYYFLLRVLVQFFQKMTSQQKFSYLINIRILINFFIWKTRTFFWLDQSLNFHFTLNGVRKICLKRANIVHYSNVYFSFYNFIPDNFFY